MEQRIKFTEEEQIDSFLCKDGKKFNLTDFEKKRLADEELERRFARSSSRDILDEVYNKRREQNRIKIAQMKKVKRRQLIFREYATKAAIYMSSLIIGVSSIVLVKKVSDEISQPVNIVATDMMANSKLLEVDGKYIDAKEFDVADTDKLYKYIIENNIEKDEIYSAIAERCKLEFIDYEFAITRLNERYPEIFEEALEKNKTR